MRSSILWNYINWIERVVLLQFSYNNLLFASFCPRWPHHQNNGKVPHAASSPGEPLVIQCERHLLPPEAIYRCGVLGWHCCSQLYIKNKRETFCFEYSMALMILTDVHLQNKQSNKRNISSRSYTCFRFGLNGPSVVRLFLYSHKQGWTYCKLYIALLFCKQATMSTHRVVASDVESRP